MIRALLKVVVGIAFRYRPEGQQKVPALGPVILAGNHSTGWDPIFIACALKRQVSYMAKVELFEIPVFGSLLHMISVFPVKRGTVDRFAVRKSLEILGAGGALGIFPAGTRRRDGSEHKGLPGAAYFAAKTGATVLPVGVKVHEGFRPEVNVRFGDPLDLGKAEGRIDSATLDVRTAVVMSAIKQLAGRRADGGVA